MGNKNASARRVRNTNTTRQHGAEAPDVTSPRPSQSSPTASPTLSPKSPGSYLRGSVSDDLNDDNYNLNNYDSSEDEGERSKNPFMRRRRHGRAKPSDGNNLDSRVPRGSGYSRSSRSSRTSNSTNTDDDDDHDASAFTLSPVRRRMPSSANANTPNISGLRSRCSNSYNSSNSNSYNSNNSSNNSNSSHVESVWREHLIWRCILAGLVVIVYGGLPGSGYGPGVLEALGVGPGLSWIPNLFGVTAPGRAERFETSSGLVKRKVGGSTSRTFAKDIGFADAIYEGLDVERPLYPREPYEYMSNLPPQETYGQYDSYSNSYDSIPANPIRRAPASDNYSSHEKRGHKEARIAKKQQNMSTSESDTVNGSSKSSDENPALPEPPIGIMQYLPSFQRSFINYTVIATGVMGSLLGVLRVVVKHSVPDGASYNASYSANYNSPDAGSLDYACPTLMPLLPFNTSVLRKYDFYSRTFCWYFVFYGCFAYYIRVMFWGWTMFSDAVQSTNLLLLHISPALAERYFPISYVLVMLFWIIAAPAMLSAIITFSLFLLVVQFSIPLQFMHWTLSWLRNRDTEFVRELVSHRRGAL